MARSDNKTVPTDQSVENFLKTVQPAHRAEDAHQLDKLFRATTGFKPVMWGPSIVGYGRYHYRYKTGREGDFLATGFSPRKSALVIYTMPGYADFADLMARLGKHKLGKSCLYVNKLADIDTGVLRELIRAGLDDLDRVWPVKPF
ncbi:DUF1801 domain-containing protein [Ruegeria sp. HKCCE3926]|uniref:DUF1801 domain-containing protein n=1 Tax=Ruegeria sp. HKCCE3926 TaxID=2794831 RepID=UPI001AE4FD45|nr:DUF1801 domain-containing protein [Ruegeria sp. HKCCE3926]